MGDATKENTTDLDGGKLQQQATIERYIEFIAAAIQVPSFLIIRKPVVPGYGGLANPLYDHLLRNWLDAAASAAPSPEMDRFVFSLASGLRADLYRDEQLAMNMAMLGYGKRGWVSGYRLQIMTSWMLTTPISQIAKLTASWLRMIDADEKIDGTATVTVAEDGDRRAALAWEMIQTSAHGLSFRSARSQAFAPQTIIAAVDGRCGLT